MMHVHPHAALADTLPFVMLDISSRPVGCSDLAFRELIQPPLTALASWTRTGHLKMAANGYLPGAADVSGRDGKGVRGQ